jgi:hypothetical protein
MPNPINREEKTLESPINTAKISENLNFSSIKRR